MTIPKVRMIDFSRTDHPVPVRARSRGIPPALEGFERASTPVIRLAERSLEELFGEHKILVAGQDAAHFVLSYHADTLFEVTFGYIDYRVRAELRGICLQDYVVFMATNGHARFRCCTGDFQSSTISSVIVNPRVEIDVLFEADSPHLFVKFAPPLLERQLCGSLGRSLRDSIVFSNQFDLSMPSSWRWHTAVQLLHEELYSQDDMTHNPFRVRALEGYLATTLLLLGNSIYSAALFTPDAAERGSRTLRLSIKYMNEHLDEDLSLEDLAHAVGASQRTIQKAFQEELRTSPTVFLRDLRLDRIRADILTSGTQAETLGRIAERWGMHHYGRFAQAYRARFGETPSATLTMSG
ncbi:helix-turn-helix transcriptional regulator [Ferrimicrobium acidiphilum]|uniref:AraC family transcriptional regulator n=1 Tax=Ferrimicrobium acidiphilum TaxID=121039 RepID=A0ABV3Y4P3_9ACTN